MASRFAALAQRLIQKSGKSVVLASRGVPATPEGGGTVTFPNEILGRSKMVFESFGFMVPTDSSVLAGDLKALMDPLQIALVPEAEDIVYIGDAVFGLDDTPTDAQMQVAIDDDDVKALTVKNVETIYDGEDVAAYRLQVRG